MTTISFFLKKISRKAIFFQSLLSFLYPTRRQVMIKDKTTFGSFLLIKPSRKRNLYYLRLFKSHVLTCITTTCLHQFKNPVETKIQTLFDIIILTYFLSFVNIKKSLTYILYVSDFYYLDSSNLYM